MLPHEKIIKTTAKRILEPEKLFQVGNSRCYLDDNGYFMIQVELQPVTYMKGSGLNVGIAFLWESTKALNDTLARSYGGASIENMLLKATELGLGTLWIANTCLAYEDMMRFIASPGQLIGAVAVGYADESPNPRPRKDMKEVLEYR